MALPSSMRTHACLRAGNKLSKAYPIPTESAIIRQFIFPVIAFNGGPGLQIRSAGITDQLSALPITELTGAKTIT